MRGIFLPLKLTGGIDIVSNFEGHIAKKLGPELVSSVHATFEEMQKLRNALDFNKMQAQLNNDYRLAPEFQQQISNYIRYVYLVDTFFRNDFPDAKTLKVNFNWTDSFQPKKTKMINHIKYELVSCLYNLAICYYTEGIHQSLVSGPQEKLKAIGKLRSALWCINEVKQVLPTLLVKPDDLPSDLNLSYINLLHNYFIGLTYAALMEVMSADKKNGPEKLASINKAAAKHFQIAFDIIFALKPNPIPDVQAKSLRMNLLYNSIMFRSEAYFQIAQVHLLKVDEEIRQGHMGLAVSYLRITKADFDDILQKKADLDLLTPDQKAALLARAQLIKTNYDTCLLKNQKVYQQPEYTGEQLPEIAEEKSQITPIEPRDIKKKLDDERFFEVFLSPELLQLKGEFTNYVSMTMLEVENNLKNANNVKNKRYAEGYVNYLLDLQSQTGEKKVEIPPQLKEKIDRFKKNGGVNAYLFTKKNIAETSVACAKLIQDIKAAIAAEKQEDDQIRQQHPGQWNRAYSEQVGQEYVLKLRDLEQKFFLAQNTDKDVNKKFDQYVEWMNKFSMPDEQILALIPQSSDTEFINQNRPKLTEIAQVNQKISALIDVEKQRAVVIAITEEFLKTDFMSSFSAINSKSVDKQTEFEKIIAPYKTKLAQIAEQMNQAYPLIDQISGQAKAIISSRNDSNQNTVKLLEEMNLAINVINDIFNDLQQGVKFYGSLNFHLVNFQKVVSDFCMAREIEKNALLQELQAQMNSSKFNSQGSYFNNNTLKFPEGQSVFMQPGQKPPVQGNMPGQQANPTQMYGQQTQPQMGQMYGQPQNQPYNPQLYGHPMQGQPQNQIYYPNQAQPQNQMYMGQGNQQYGGNVPYGGNTQAQMGYMPLPQKNDSQGQGLGQFGNIVESTFIPANQQHQGNFPYGQGQGPSNK